MPRTLDRSRIERICGLHGDLRDRDTLFVLCGDDGSLRIMAHDPRIAEAVEAAEVVMDENGDLLQALA
jgi:hypothetical protein